MEFIITKASSNELRAASSGNKRDDRPAIAGDTFEVEDKDTGIKLWGISVQSLESLIELLRNDGPFIMSAKTEVTIQDLGQHAKDPKLFDYPLITIYDDNVE